MADTTRAACHRCGSADAVNVSSGYPDHVWRWWRVCGTHLGHGVERAIASRPEEDSWTST